VPDALATFRLAQEALLTNRPAEALELLATISGDDSIVLFQSATGVAHHLLGNLPEAVAAFRAAIDVERRQLASLHYNLGAALAAAGELDDAASSYIDALALQPQLQVALINLAVVRQGQGRGREAESVLRTALDREPGDLSARYNLGAVLCGLGRYVEAEAELRAAGDLQGAAAGLASALAAQGRHAEAIEAYRTAIVAEPDRPDALRGLAAALVTEGHAEEALAFVERAAALAQDDDTDDLRGTCFASLGRYEEAATEYRRVLVRTPGRASTMGNLGTVLDRLDQHDAAAEMFTAALAADPEHRASRIGLAGALAGGGRLAEASAVYQELAVRDPDNPGWQHMVASLGGDNPAMPPDGYIARVFDSYAPRFEQHLVESLGYRVPVMIRDALAGRGRFAAALDLGCGTGLVGVELRPRVDTLHGVDLAPKMIEQARAKGIYDELAVAELSAHLDAAAEPRYALIVAGDVFCYLGELAPTFAAARRRLAPGGVLAFTVERGDDDYRLGPAGRYAHSGAYLARLAETHGLAVAACESVPLRLEHGRPVEGWLCTMVAP